MAKEMTKKEVIDNLKMQIELMLYNSMTGESVDFRSLNELNQQCYVAMNTAIEMLEGEKYIPAKWIEDYIAEMEKVNPYGRVPIETLKEMLHKWENRNEEERKTLW